MLLCVHLQWLGDLLKTWNKHHIGLSGSAVPPEGLVALPESLLALPWSLLTLPESLLALPESLVALPESNFLSQ